MRFRGGEFSTGTTGNFQPELTDGSMVSIGTATLQRIGDVKYTDPSGKKSSLLNKK